MLKFIAEVAQSATNRQNGSGDTRFSNSDTLVIEYSGDTLDVGIASGKNAIRYGSAAHFDTSPIPLGAKIDKTQIVLHSSANESVALTVRVDVLELTTRLDAVDRQYHDGNLRYIPDSGTFGDVVSLWDDGTTDAGSTNISISENRNDGVGSVSQAWTANGEDALSWHWFRAANFYVSSDTRVRARVYTAKGSAGSYYKGALLLDGELTDVSSWGTVTAAHYLLPSRDDWTPTDGEVYITEIEVVPGASPTPSGNIVLSWDLTADGSVQNETSYAAEGTKIQGFGGTLGVSPQWESGNALLNADDIGTSDVVTFPAMLEDTSHAFGSSEFSGATTLANFKTHLQTALDNRTSTDQWIGLRLSNWLASGGALRIFYSIDSDQPADTLPGFKGWVLEIHYTLPHKSVPLAGSASSVAELVGSGTSEVALAGTATSVAVTGIWSPSALTGSGTSTHSTLSATGVSRKELDMTDDQDVTHIRGDDLQMPVTVTLDESRTLDGTETWKWVLRRGVDTPSLISKTSPSSGVTVDGATYQPTVVLAGSDFPTSTFDSSVTDQLYLHELQMVKSSKTETVLRGSFTVRSDVVL